MILDESNFSDKRELFNYLVKNKEELIYLKKSAIKFADPIEYSVASTNKSLLEYPNTDDLEAGIIKRAIVANTYNWLDSHGDVHLDGVFSKTLKESKDKILFLHDHIMQLNGKIGKFTDIVEKQINWVDFGINIPGATTALIGIGDIKKSMNEIIYSQYLANDIDQHSVGMQYVNISLAINDTSYKHEYAIWQRHINNIGNMKKAYDKGYFWAISEAKLKEISAVIAGSNELTPTIQPTKSLENKPIDGKQAGIDYKYLIKNFKIN